MKTIHKNRIKQWIKALRSDKYKQGRGQLRSIRNTYCCLGVATEVKRLACRKGQWVKTELSTSLLSDKNVRKNKLAYEYIPPSLIHIPSALELTEDVKRYYGLKESNPYITSNGKPLSHLNDKSRWNFKQIAKLLEDTYIKSKKK